MEKIKALNNDPVAKLKYLKQLLSLPTLTPQQQSKIYTLIQDTEKLVYNTGQQQQQQQPSNIKLVPSPTKNHQAPRELLLTQSYTDTNVLSSHYASDEARAEAEFEMEQRRRMDAFKEAQRRRRMEYQTKLTEIENGKVDSLKLFGLGPNYTFEELKHSYKRLALETHPDRPGGSTEKFQVITKCYMSLLEKIKNTEEKSFLDLKKDSTNYYKRAGTGTSSIHSSTELYRTGGTFKGNELTSGQVIDPNAKSFNVRLFNQVYEANKLWDPNDDGYDDWFRKGEVDDVIKAPPIFSNKFNLDVFNSTFGDWKTQIDSGKSIIAYQAPQELINTSAGWSIIDAGQKIGDFTKAADQPGALNYTDLKLAYNGNCNMINPALATPREEYKSIDDLKRKRETINYTMTPQEMALEEARKYAELQAETARIERLQYNDRIQGDHYTNMHQRMLGYSKKAEY